MPRIAHDLPDDCPRAAFIMHDGKRYSLHLEIAGWRLRKRSKGCTLDFSTGTKNLRRAEGLAKEWLQERGDNPITSRKGGGTLAALAALYLSTPKRTKANVAKDNVSRLRTICRATLGRELAAVTCREIGPDFWQAFQRKAAEKAGHPFDLATRRRENVATNSAVRCARCLFLPALIRVYRAAGLDVPTDAGTATMLPEPYVPPSTVDDAALLRAVAGLATTNRALWAAVGLARFAGLRREEIAHARAGWIEQKGGVVLIVLRDRPEEQWWTKTGRPYRAQVIEPALAEHLAGVADFAAPDSLIVPDPSTGDARSRWFERVPQEWLHANGVTAAKPLHRLRGLYADHLAQLTADAIADRRAGVKAAQESLGHTTSATTENHYLTP